MKPGKTFTIKAFLLMLTLGMVLGMPCVKAQMYYANLEGSRAKISDNSSYRQLKNLESNFFCEGDFTMINGTLQNISSLKFSMPLNLQKRNQLLIEPALVNTSALSKNMNFELTHAMVLPLMNKIHIIGFLAIEGARNRVDFQFDYIENDENTITVMGTKMIELGDYKKTYAVTKNKDEVLLNLKMVLKKPMAQNYFASAAKIAK
ncbi:MAG: hypothetical protein V4541_13325 [Bacteroidota bacterium]